MKRAHTVHGPSRYLPGTSAAEIEAIETATVRTGQLRERNPTQSEYIRELSQVIGWDRGEDARISFAECSGGIAAGRAYHGRPMSASNIKLEPA
jgi:hypothetical protein